MLINFLYIFLLIFAIKLLLNLSYYIQCKRFLDEYTLYLKEPSWKFQENEIQIIKLFKNAGIEDRVFSNIEEIGYGKLQHSRPSVFNNISVKRSDVANLTLHMFHKSIGVYRSRIIEAINPLYWIETIIFLPKQLFNYFGLSAEGVIIKIAQILYWIFLFLLGVYKDEVEQLIKGFLS